MSTTVSSSKPSTSSQSTSKSTSSNSAQSSSGSKASGNKVATSSSSNGAAPNKSTGATTGSTGNSNSSNPTDKVAISKETSEPDKASNVNVDALAGTQNGNSDPYSTVTVQKWGSGENDCVYNALKGAGWTDQEISEQGLISQVAGLNGLQNPDIVQTGQQLKIPQKGDSQNGGAASEGGATGETGTVDGVNGTNGQGDQGLQDQIMGRAKEIGDEINATGGYRFDGVNDCYGFVRRVWDPVLQEKGLDKLPVADGPNSDQWGKIDDWSKLKPGDVLSTAQGHEWGDKWHGGLYAGTDANGNPMIYDNSGSGSAQLHTLPRDDYFGYFYKPTHDMLNQDQGGQADASQSQGAGSTAGTGEIPDFGNDPSRAQVGQQLDAAAQKYGIPPELLKAVAWQESGWQADASSFDGGHGKGVMQIDDRFHDFAGTPDVWNSAANINYGANFLSDLFEQTGSWDSALLRYNGGSDYPPLIHQHMNEQPWSAYV